MAEQRQQEVIGTPAGRRRVRLTDQALVAVTLARSCADAHGRDRADVVDLLAGLATEPDGLAGPLLRAHAGTAAALAERHPVPPPHLPTATIAIAWAAGDVADARPISTRDLLAACAEVGGSDLRDWLALAGSATAVTARPRADDLAETYRLDPNDATREPAAARAVARARAAGGSALDLVRALARESEADPELPVPSDFDDRQRHLTNKDPARRSDTTTWDHGLEAVLAAAEAGRLGATRPLTALELLRACVTVGGQGPRALLAPNREQSR